MKKILKYLIRLFGYKLIRTKTTSSKAKSINSRRILFHHTPTGNYYLPQDAHGDVVVDAILNGRVWEKEIVSIAANYIKPNTNVIDVGSNFGQMAILFSKMVGKEGKVFALDANEFVFEILKKNIQANKKEGKIIPIFGAVHNVAGKILFFPYQDFKKFDSYGSYGIDYTGETGKEVLSITIDNLKIDGPISFMKVDVQGGDLLAMQGAKQTIKKEKMPIIFEYETQFEDELDWRFQDYVEFVAEIDYKFEKVIGHNYLIIPK